jgi:tetratricopeptide (TPR) repeat protein/predicted Ser/Thr protein kinase
MSTERHARVKAVFLAAMELELGARADHLEHTCAGDAELRLEVEELLLGHASSDSFLDTPLLAEQRSLAALLGDEGVRLSVPDEVGEYEVIRRLGVGGMGIVYLARQRHPRREVALKVVRPGLASPRTLRRLEYEAELLGRLSHEGIAKIHEAGTARVGDEVVPFFAMEYVEGVTLIEYADEKRLGEAARLELLAQVADAVHHAHQKGVVHRDLKPSNILVTAAGEPKVLDFGVARATDGDLHATSMDTASSQLLGTLAYMSPEQAAGDAARLDARADVYALGVLAFQLLTGALPHDLAGKPLAEAARRVAEDAPRRIAEVRTGIAADLELIVHTALDADPERRYASAEALAADLRRYLGHQPIAARRPSVAYLASKFARRHSGGVAAAVVALLGVVGLGYGMWRARLEEHQAELAHRAALSEAQGAREMFDLWLATFDGQAPGSGVTVPMLESLEETVEGLETRYAERPELAGELHLTIGYTFLRFGEFEKAKARLESGIAAYTAAYGAHDERTLNARANLASVFVGMRDADGAVTLLRDVRALSCEHLGREHKMSIFALGRLGSMLAMAGDVGEAQEVTEEALEAQVAAFGTDDLRTVSTRYSLAALRRVAGELEAALELIESVCQAFDDEALFARQPSLKWSALAEKARILSALGRGEEALGIQMALLAGQLELYGDPAHSGVLLAREEVARLHGELGQLDEAIAETREVLRVSAETKGEGHPDTCRVSYTLARFLFRTDEDDAEGEEVLVRVVAFADEAETARSDHVDQHLLLGRHLARKERYAEAAEQFQRALVAADRVYPEGSKAHIKVLEHIAFTEQFTEDPPE